MTEERQEYITDPTPWKTVGVLAIARYLIGEINEGVLAQKLGTDRLDARRQVAEFLGTAIENAQVPIERITILEQRAATLTTKCARLELGAIEASEQIVHLEAQVHDLRNQLQIEKFRADELALDLESERHKLADLAAKMGVAESPSEGEGIGEDQ